jgi:hypothetical protein
MQKGGMPLAQTKTRRKKKSHTDQVRDILCEYSPEAAQCLCGMLEDDSLTGSTRAGVAKEILERTVGKGQMTDPAATVQTGKFELIVRVEE